MKTAHTCLCVALPEEDLETLEKELDIIRKFHPDWYISEGEVV